MEIKQNSVSQEIWTQANYPLKFTSDGSKNHNNDDIDINNQDETPKLATKNGTEKVIKEYEQPSVAVPKSAASFNLINKGLYGYRKQKTELPRSFGRQSTLGNMQDAKKSAIFQSNELDSYLELSKSATPIPDFSSKSPEVSAKSEIRSSPNLTKKNHLGQDQRIEL